MFLQNEPYPQDVRVRSEAQTLVGAGHEVTVFAPVAAGQARTARVDGVEVRRYRIPEAAGGVASFAAEYGAAHAQLFPRGLAALRRGTDVVHLHNPPDTLFPLALAARAAGRSSVFDMHDLFPELIGLRTGSSRLERIGRSAQRASLRSASAVIVTNESQREIAIQAGDLPEDRVTVVRNGPPQATLAPARVPRTGPLGAPRLVYLGALGPQDGVLELPALMRHPSLATAHLDVLGDGPAHAAIEAEVAASPELAGRVTLLGRVEHDRVPGLLGAADIAVDPAPCTAFNHRSTMVKIGEYLAARLPVVAYDLVETRRTADDAALLVPCGSVDDLAHGVARIARDESLRYSLSVRAAARATALVWERSAVALLGLYENLAAQRG